MATDLTKIKVGDSYLCPVCGQYTFERAGDDDICDVCNWQEDPYNMKTPTRKSAQTA